MKLVASNLVGAYEQTEELRRLDAVTENAQLMGELTELSQKIQGCMHLIDELTLAKDSLKTAGYSTEWFDIINRDNNFMAVVDVEMPKFFGGDEAKQAACEGAIIDTIKKWAKAVWEWIKAFYVKIKKALVWIMGLWVHQGRPKGELETTYRKVVDLMEKNGGQTEAAVKYCFADISQKDPDAIIPIIKSYAALSDIVVQMGSIMYDITNSPLGKQLQEAISREIEGSRGCVIQVLQTWWVTSKDHPEFKVPPDMKHNGFMFVASDNMGIQFAPVCESGDQIPVIKFGYSSFDKPQQEHYLKQLGVASQLAYDTVKSLDDKQKLLDSVKRKIESDVRQMTANVNVDNEDPEYLRKQVTLRNFTTLTNIFGTIVTKLMRVSTTLDRDARVIQSKMSSVMKDL